MSRSLLTIAFSFLFAGAAAAQCQRWYPVYPVVGPAFPLTPAIWGAPAPKPLPPALPPFVPKAGVGVREDDEPATPPTAGEKKESSAPKEKEPTRIPKTRIPLPGDPVDKPLPKETPNSDSPKKNSPAGKTVEQFVIPSDGKGEPRPEVKVGFFNHSDREIVLVVNGESVRLPSEQYVTLRLPRTFQWAEKGVKGTDVVVPPDADGIEIVFRK